MKPASIPRLSLAAAAALVLVATTAPLGHAGEAKPALDAVCVRVDVPPRLLAHQVFEAKVTMRNTGTQAWDDGMKLRSQDPLDNTNWGTTFIIMGQGRSAKPGEEVIFKSNLKAPGTPGKVAFRWRVARIRGNTMFGEATPPKTILVEPRPPEPAPKPPTQDPARKPVLSFGDFEYAGSFKLPDRVEGCGAAYTESGLALRTMPDGARRLFVRTGLRRQIIYEAEIPDLVRLADTDHAALHVAAVRKVWGELGLAKPGEEAVAANAGFWWDEPRSTLYWSTYHGYHTGRRPVLGASNLEPGGKVTHYGPWWIPDSVPWFKSYWGGVVRLSDAFARTYTGGKTLALGFGGYYSICAPCSKGPALAAIAEPDPSRKTVDIVELLAYPWSKPAATPRDGDYFVTATGWGGRPPISPTKGSWTMDDAVRAGIFIDLPHKHAYVAFARLGTGRIGYDYGAIRSAGHAHTWYFYDPADLGEAAKGTRKPWDTLPHSRARVTYPSGIADAGKWPNAPGAITGACFDEQQSLLYLYQRFCIDNGSRELFPCVHAYRVKPPVK